MLNDYKDIDRIFQKLGDYEKTPPKFLWENIQEELTEGRRVRRVNLFKTIGVAAAILLAFIAGWWVTSQSEKEPGHQNSFAEQGISIKKNSPSANENAIVTNIQPPKTTPAVTGKNGYPETPVAPSTNISSLATFAAGTSFLRDHQLSKIEKQGDLVLYNTEKDFLDKLHQNFKIVHRLSEWLATIRKDSLKNGELISNPVVNREFKDNISKNPVEVAINNRGRSDSRWIVKAEISPLFNNQPQSNNQKSVAAVSYRPQETSIENSFSGSMIAGYKVGKRLIVKSGIGYSNIRQTTRNLDLMGTNAIYNVPVNATLASTPAGQVNLDQTVSKGAKEFLNSDVKLATVSQYTPLNELKQNLEFIEIPVQATYKLIDSRFNVGITGGVSTNILVGNRAILSENGERISTGETSNMRNIVYSGAVGLEIGYEITNRITLTVEPRLKHFVNSLSTSKSIDYKPSQLGIVTGLTYSFN